MSAREEVDATASLLGWEVSEGTYLRGDYCVQVDYTASGGISSASAYHFYSINDLKLQEQAIGKHKKEKVMAWLAA